MMSLAWLNFSLGKQTCAFFPLTQTNIEPVVLRFEAGVIRLLKTVRA